MCERTRYQKRTPTVRNMRAVLKKASWGTRRIFKGPQNSRLHRLWTAYCRTGRIFSARNGPRSEVIRLKRDLFQANDSFVINQISQHFRSHFWHKGAHDAVLFLV